MKQIKLIISLVLILSLGTSVFFKLKNPSPPKNIVVSSAKIVHEYNHVNEMSKASPLIVIGVKGSEKTDIVYDSSGIVDRFDTISNFKIKKVIKNETGNVIDNSSTISLLENAAYDEKTKELLSVEGYQLMKKNKRYLLYLEPNKSTGGPYVGSYNIMGVLYGKFAFEKDKQERDSLDELESSAYESTTKKNHKNLYQEVIQKYSKVNEKTPN